ncbi:xanthine dehydrogenase family protein molybdopterin-binding subunit [Paracoccus saliphilus]|uniref:Isoquinoline 1-oxidoreductase, beta subunit n=1 Tax=Paracoccus saliphilus TaxID=405559 RepID=A0AA45W464_9RHOB|nr:xanthine dehydrogenase family protein molybdopterin-binding subunit [Paracoccus saliphilus]WCR04166.1 xanthine dehydrogenase family protein molybdopterin-binding subunit [Paracoccus saliphilus]SIS81592.1 isoquinoline 1-oxidoreductase, beta subunit [Paracoccus saliphilus]
MNIHTSRRAFLSGLIVAVALPGLARAQQKSGAAAFFNELPEGSGEMSANAFIRVAPDNTVTVLIKHIEFGQGPYTGLTTLVAEEMDADWSQMRAAAAPADVEKYANTAFGMQGTGGSTAMANSFMQMRKAGAGARAMLIAAAAERFGVAADEITIDKGIVSAGDQSATFGELAEAASQQTAPEDPPVKEPDQFKLIGTDLPKVDSSAKTDGSAQFTLDVYRDGMLTAVVAHPPKFGAKVASFDDSAALQVSGVQKVAQVPTGVAVYADNTYAALKGRDALEIEWDEAEAETRSSDAMIEEWTTAAKAGGKWEVTNTGDVEAALEGSEIVEATYVFPYLAHTPMEPLDAVVELRDGEAEVWMGSQMQTGDQGTIAKVLGVENVRLHTMLAGGSFGRRATPDSHFAAEAAEVAKANGKGAVKLMWTREDDVQGGYYRPLTVHHMRAALDDQGGIKAWDHGIAAQSVVMGTPFEAMLQGGPDFTAFEGANELHYATANHRLRWAQMESPVSTLWWRSVGHTHTGYAVECFIDELLEKAGKDPIEGRLALMGDDHPRERAVLERVAEMADQSGDYGYGVAVVKSFGSYVAQIAEIEDRGGIPHVRRVWCAVDCGLAVNPNVVRAQMEGGIGYGLSAALYSEVTLDEGGLIRQQNWDSYRILRIPEMPAIEVAIIPSAEAPTGVGEPGTPPIAPAIANAWRRMTGNAYRRLPIIPVA